jgi:hypothetical protein
MNWMQKIALPIQVTPEVNAFADQCVSILFENPENIVYNDAFYEETLSFNGKDIPIAVMMKRPEESAGLASAETPAMWDRANSDSQRGWSLSSCYINIHETIPPRNDRREIKKAIIHELIHCVDEKLNDPELFDTGWHQKHRRDMGAPKYVGSPNHYTAPWEQDAFMSSEAYDQVSMWKRMGVSSERAMQQLRNFIPDNPKEKEWRKSPDLWRRYMQTMARTVQEIYNGDT